MQITEYKTVKAQIKALISKPKTGLAAEYRLLNWLEKRHWRRMKEAAPLEVTPKPPLTETISKDILEYIEKEKTSL